MLTARKEGEVVSLHPKLVDKWARRYIKIYNDQGAVIAKKWANSFLPEMAKTAMSIRVKEILEKRKGPRGSGPSDQGGK